MIFSALDNFKKHAFSIGVLILLGAGTFSYYRDMRPFAPDDLIGIAFGSLQTPSSLFTNNWSDGVPGYRPISGLIIWLQYQLVGIEPISYYVFNIIFVLGCAIILYLLIFQITKSTISSFFAAWIQVSSATGM
jgi:hypothetical protein